MMKKFLLLSAVFTVLTVTPVCASGDIPEVPMGETFPDFSVETIAGDTFSLADALEDKDAVLIFFFRDGCPSCTDEFAFLNSLYEALGDRAAFIGLDSQEQDSPEVIRAIQEKASVAFPLAKEIPLQASAFVPYDAYPCTVIVDRYGELVFYQDYAVSDTADPKVQPVTLDEVFRTILADDYGGNCSVCQRYDDIFARKPAKPAGLPDIAGEIGDFNGYLISVVDQNEEPVPGVAMNFCSTDQCRLGTTDENGLLTLDLPQSEYHLAILDVPEGYSFEEGYEVNIEKNHTGPIVVTITKD